MRRAVASLYRCPQTGAALELEVTGADGDEIITGALRGPETNYPIVDGVPDLTFPARLPDADARVRSFYDARVADYDRYLPLTFKTFGEDEDVVREAMVARLALREDARVLEIGCGSGRDSVHIARRIPRGMLFCQDIAPNMMAAFRTRMQDAPTVVEAGIASAMHLPFAAETFDAVFQFGGVGEFSDIGRFFQEVVRVSKPGARVVVGDESIPVWLRGTEFAKLLTFTNPQFAAPLPLEHLPVEARDVNLRWIIGGTFYLIDFFVGVGEPPADFDFPIPGVRGGTHRTRYYGQLEGVTPETKALVARARERLGVSMHDWLEEVVDKAAREQLAADDRDR